jgi:hypothetical protein
MIGARQLEGERFGQLTAIRVVGARDKSGHRQWLCRCDCGTEKIVSSSNLRNGRSRSCAGAHVRNKLTPPQQRRADLYDGAMKHAWKGDVPITMRCIHHPDRIANRSGFVRYGKRQCGSCKTNRRRDGSGRPAHIRNFNRRNYKQALNNRILYFGNGMRGLKLWERIVGVRLYDLEARHYSR